MDGLPRELKPDALTIARRARNPMGVDLSVRLWPLAGDDVTRHHTRRTYDQAAPLTASCWYLPRWALPQ